MDLVPSSLLEYEIMRGIDNGVHPYMHNKMTLRGLNLDFHCSSRWNLRKVFKKEGCTIIESMKDITTFKEDYILPYMKKYK
jgi:hypothetical protein